ncbi:MAG TPA: alanine--glyoxylate aminotransferase family protein, partial [Thermoanaerobaculia bacterium]|nr:alanine--glyoxylate aminotransferase family protein [Thermoanaerobaculia bacterium]
MTEQIKFFLPGPTYVLEEVRQAMTQPMVGHRSAGYKAFYIELSKKLPPVLRTSGDVMVASGSSTLVMESAVVSCVRSDVLNLTNGAFSERWHSISKAA